MQSNADSCSSFPAQFAAMCSNLGRLVFSCIELEPSIHPSNLSSEWHGTFPTFLLDSSSCTACGWAARWCLEAGRQREPSAGALVFALRGRSLFFDLPFFFSAILVLVALFHSDLLIFYRLFAAQRFVRHLCIRKAGTFLSIHLSNFFLEKRHFWPVPSGG